MEKVNNPFCRCLNPKKVFNPYTNEVVIAPCGHCKACNLNRNLLNSFKCSLEQSQNKYTLFITLTYANRFIPRACFVDSTQSLCGADLVDKSTGEYLGPVEMSPEKREQLLKKFYLFGDVPYLRKDDLQKFFKRFRYYAGKVTKEKVRYFAVGEYGPIHFRPHFHILLFFNSEELLQVCSEIVCSCWQYGRCDVQIARNSAASYVASYVNSYSLVPQVFTLPTTKPFIVHSQKLGLGFLQGARQEVYSQTPEQFIKRGLVVNGKYTEFDLWRSAYSLFFPRCKGFVNKSSRERAYAYQLYDTARKIFPAAETTLEIARQTAALIHCFGYYPDSYLNTASDKEQREYVRYFYDADISSCPIESEQHDKWVYRIYLELLISKHFLTYVCDRHFGQTMPTLSERQRKLRMIEDFYARLDYLHLTEFFRNQQAFFDSDLCGDDDLMSTRWEQSYCPYFYNNVDVDVVMFKESPVYKLYSSYVDEQFRSRIKHKELNDRNKIFIYDD